MTIKISLDCHCKRTKHVKECNKSTTSFNLAINNLCICTVLYIERENDKREQRHIGMLWYQFQAICCDKDVLLSSPHLSVGRP